MITLLLQIYLVVLLAHVIFSWVPRPPEPIMPFVLGVRRLVEPVAAPIRRVIPPLRLGNVGLDLSIIILFIGVRILMAVTRSVGL
ncbi:YggT family protein [Egicoccus sp. AB-alg2]|uniref:YggT family protein n=1 Tax=Egicoccus sp. AB-alg2 TaxID=3242693 RepID=UPI00359D865B